MHLKYIDPTPSVTSTMVENHWFATSDTGTWAHNSDNTVYLYAYGTGSIPTLEYTTDQAKVEDAIITSNDTGFPYGLYLNSGYGNGK